MSEKPTSNTNNQSIYYAGLNRQTKQKIASGSTTKIVKTSSISKSTGTSTTIKDFIVVSVETKASLSRQLV